MIKIRIVVTSGRVIDWGGGSREPSGMLERFNILICGWFTRVCVYVCVLKYISLYILLHVC